MSNNTSNFTIQHGDVSEASGLEGIFGPFLIGTFLSMALWGITSSQTYDYFMENTDRLLQRSVVAFLWILDTVCSLMDSHTIYDYLVINYGNPAGALVSNWSNQYRALVPAFSNLTIRTMYSLRIYHLSAGVSGKNIVLVAWILALSIGEFVVSIVTTNYAVQKTMSEYEIKYVQILIYLTCCFGLAADLSVTIALCWLLQSAKSGFRRSNAMVNMLMVYIANTGLVVTLTAALELITYTTMKGNQVFFAVGMLLSKLYVNAYLASLNARGRIRERGSTSSVSLSRLDLSNARRSSQLASSGSDRKSIPAQISFQTPVERSGNENEVKSPAVVE